MVTPQVALQMTIACHDEMQERLRRGLAELIDAKLTSKSILSGASRHALRLAVCTIEVPSAFHDLPDWRVREVLDEYTANGWEVRREGAWRWHFRPLD